MTHLVEAMAYALPPDGLLPFIYNGKDPVAWLDINTTECIIGRLYVHNQNTGQVTEIGADTATIHASTKDYLYYVSADQTIIQTDYAGSSFVPLYQASRGNITFIHTFGDLLCFVEANQYVVMLDIKSQVVETVLVQDDVDTLFLFDTDKLIWRDTDNNAYYYNITEDKTTALATQHDLMSLINPYIAPEQYQETDTHAINSTSSVGVADLYNDIAFPLPEYPAYLQYNFADLTNVQSYFNRSYASSHQCDGFAKYAHDRFWHICGVNDDREQPSWVESGGGVTNDYYGANYSDTFNQNYDPSADSKTPKFTSLAEIVSFFRNLDRGTFLRYTSYADETPHDGNHSIVFDGLSEDGSGFYAYECNQDTVDGLRNAVGYQKYSFTTIEGHYELVLYYIEHTLTAPVYSSTTKHKTPCGNCNGYLMRPHTKVAVNRAASMTNHTVGYQCCSGGVSQQHTGSATYQQYNDAKHKVSFSCCTGTVVQNHTYVNSRCTGCGKNKGVSGGIVASIPGIEETLNG